MMRKIYRDGLPYIYEEDHLAALEAAVKEKDEEIATLRAELGIEKAEVALKCKDCNRHEAFDENVSLRDQVKKHIKERDAIADISDLQAGEITALRAERDGYVKTHRENVEALLATNTRQAEAIKRLQRKHHPVCSCWKCMGLKEDPYPPDALKGEEAVKCEICEKPMPKDYEYSICKDCADTLRQAKVEPEGRILEEAVK